MPVKAGPKDETRDSLVFGYNMADLAQSYDGYPVENSVSKNETLRRYNNPGFSGYNRDTGRVHPDTNTPIWELAFYPQDEGRVSRLTSTEGYGCYHGMGRNLYADTKYLASIMMKEGPGTRFIDNDMNHGYSNIGGWNSNGTTRTKEYVGNGWWRFYTIWSNGSTSYSLDGVTPLCTRYSGNTYSDHTLDAGEHVVSVDIYPYQYIPGGESNFRGNYSFGPYLYSDYDGVGATMVDWGFDENMTKPEFNPVFNYPNPQSTLRMFYRINMPAPGTVRMRARSYGVCEYLQDSKYWKIRFSDTVLNKRELIWVTAPMIHEIPSTGYKKPWRYVDGVREGGLKDIVTGEVMNLSNVTKRSIENGFEFDGTDDAIVFPYSNTDLDGDALFSVEGVFQRKGTMGNRGFWGIGGDESGRGINGYTYGGSGNRIGIDLWGYRTYTLSVEYPLNEYVHVVWVKHGFGFNTDSLSIYVNGVRYTGSDFILQRNGGDGSVNLNTSNSNRGINIGKVGSATNNYYGIGSVPLFKVYNQPITDEEVQTKFNSVKSQYNIV